MIRNAYINIFENFVKHEIYENLEHLKISRYTVWHLVSLCRYLVKASVILLPLLGLTWVFGLFAVNENTAVFAWLFTILNSLQVYLVASFPGPPCYAQLINAQPLKP